MTGEFDAALFEVGEQARSRFDAGEFAGQVFDAPRQAATQPPRIAHDECSRPKQTQLTGELAAVQKTIVDQTAAIAPVQVKLGEAYPPADAAYSAYVDARKPVDAAKANLIAIWNRHKADTLASAIRKKRLDADEAHAAFQATLANVAVTRADIDARKLELAAAIVAIEQQQLEVTNQATTVAEAEKTATEASKTLDEAKATFAAKQTVVQAVSEASAKTDAALQKLPGDVELTSVAQKLKDRLETLAKEAAVLEQTMSSREAAMKEVALKLVATKQSLAASMTEMANRQQAVTAKSNVVNHAIEAAKEAESAVAAGRGKLIDLWTADAGVRSLKQLSPEQMGWSVMQATGVLEPQRPAADAEVEKTVTKASIASDAALAKLREMKVEQQLNEIMRGNVAPFVGLYAASAGQPQDDFFATPDQALFVANGGTVVGWAGGGPLAQRLAPLTDGKAFADELYLSTLTRRPTEVEVNEAVQYLASRPTERPNAIRELIWSLVTSAEFRFNH